MTQALLFLSPPQFQIEISQEDFCLVKLKLYLKLAARESEKQFLALQSLQERKGTRKSLEQRLSKATYHIYHCYYSLNKNLLKFYSMRHRLEIVFAGLYQQHFYALCQICSSLQH